MTSLSFRFLPIVLFPVGLLEAAAPSSSSPSHSGPWPQAQAIQWTPIGMEILPAIQRARDIGPAGGERVLSISVSLPYARPESMQAYVDAVSDPRSPTYRRFLAPDDVGERFGLPKSRVQAVADYLGENGLTISLVCKNHLAILAKGTVGQAELAFHTTIREYTIVPQNDVEPDRFIANSTPIRLPADLASIVLDVSGLETYTRPQRRVTILNPSLTRGLYNTVGLFNGGDTGAGRTIGVSSFDGFRSADWLAYINAFGLPVPPGGAGSNITVIGVNGGGTGAGAANAEGDLDIQMELGMAPLASIRVYDPAMNNDLIGVLSTEANDNACDVISESYGWFFASGSSATAAHNQHLSMNAQGITYMAASGDHGTALEPYSYPDFEPELLLVGGTEADVSSPSGARLSENGWMLGGGGWSTNTATFNVRPPWQTGNGVPAVNPVNDHRLVPDVSFHSNGNPGAYYFYSGGSQQNGYIGTSFASPMFAGSLGIIEQAVIALGGLTPDGAGKRRFGRIQDLIYSQNGRSDIWYDVLSGNNGVNPDGTPSICTAGWDTVTGWGPMDCGAFVPVAACETGGDCGLGTPFCAGDGIDPDVTTPCPCFNFGAAGHGCANSVNASGAVLTASGTTNPDTMVLSSSGERPASLSIFLQGTGSASAGLVYGDGIRCVNGTLKRLYAKNAVAGVVSAPQGGDPSITARSAALGDPIPSGATRHYQVYYRDPDSSFCPSATFNISNGFKTVWP